ncbi:MAG: hypothetical protein R2852_07465 [Bacteroidia bacterium]
MAKKRNLNGLPNTLVQRYFSTLFFWSKGYKADWIWNAANEKGVNEIEIDLLNDSVFPKELELKPIHAQLSRLRATIRITLENNKFPKDFIVDAKFNIFVSEKYKILRLLTCQAMLKDHEGRTYQGKIYTEQAYTEFKVFPISIQNRIKILMKKINKK